MEPTISFFTNKATQCVELIVMVSNEFVLRALPGVHKGKDQAVEYWTSISPLDLQNYLTSHFEVSRFLWDSIEDEGTKGEEWDYADGLVWEVSPVQLWAKGHTLTKDFVRSIAEFMGNGDEFVVGDIVLEYPDFEPGNERARVKDSLGHNERRCPWCGITGLAAFNFFTPDLLNYAEQYLDLESPVLWTDGVWSDASVDSKSSESTYIERGESLISCPNCSAVFLASTIEATNPPGDFEPSRFETWIQPGRCALSDALAKRTDAKFVEANLDQTLRYLKENLELNQMINWEQWTAAQQVVSWASYLIRRGEPLTGYQDQLGRQLLKQFSQRVSQIVEGTLESMSPNYKYEPGMRILRHHFELFEAIPLANMARISRTSEDFEASEMASEYFQEHFESISTSEDLDALDIYIEQRKLLDKVLNLIGDARWAVHSGELGTSEQPLA